MELFDPKDFKKLKKGYHEYRLTHLAADVANKKLAKWLKNLPTVYGCSDENPVMLWGYLNKKSKRKAKIINL